MSCSDADDDSGDMLPLHRFTSRPVRLIVSSALPAPCFPAVDYVILWYRDVGVTMTREVRDSSRIFYGRPVGGEVGLIPDDTLDANVRAETRISLTSNEDIFAAEISLGKCDPQTIAHELGHALGLPHSSGKNLMNEALDGGEWTLTDEQRAWIRD